MHCLLVMFPQSNHSENLEIIGFPIFKLCHFFQNVYIAMAIFNSLKAINGTILKNKDSKSKHLQVQKIINKTY